MNNFILKIKRIIWKIKLFNFSEKLIYLAANPDRKEFRKIESSKNFCERIVKYNSPNKFSENQEILKSVFNHANEKLINFKK